MEVEDFGTAFVRFDNGMVLHFCTYWAAHADSLGPNVILGTKGGLQFGPLTLFRDEFGVMTNVQPQSLPGPDGFLGEIKAFTKAIREGEPSSLQRGDDQAIDVAVGPVVRDRGCWRHARQSFPTNMLNRRYGRRRPRPTAREDVPSSVNFDGRALGPGGP